MAKIAGKPTVTLAVTLSLTEEEAAALNALTAYGVDPFLEVFYKYLGASCLGPHEAGLRSLFDSIHPDGANLSKLLKSAAAARVAFQEQVKS